MLKYILTSKTVAPKLKVRHDPTRSTCYDCRNDCVIFGNDLGVEDGGFMRHLREVHNCAIADFYSLSLWTILHEIGHHYTIDYAEDDLIARSICAVIPLDVAAANPDLQDLYFNIESEWEATEWAIDWINSHPNLAKILNYFVKE